MTETVENEDGVRETHTAEGVRATDAPEGVATTDTPKVRVSNATPEGDISDATPEEGDTFPRDYVEKLRDENAKYRQRAQDRDDVAQRLHTALVAATGRLADAADLPFDEEHIVDPDKMIAAIDELLQAKPHLASRKPSGSIGQGVSVASDTVSLSGLLKANAS